MKNIPIVIPCYNRIEPLKRLLDSLSEAYYKDETPIIFSIDYSDSSQISDFIDNYEWGFGEKCIIKHSQNIGLKNNILFCGNLTEKYDAIILLEDDLVVAKDFYNYAIQAYNYYKEDSRIAGISLYGYERSEVGLYQFYPVETNYDTYLMEWPSSWGQMWTKEQWRGFISWLNDEAKELNCYNIPDSVKQWNEKSWKKWAVAYCVDKNKYYLYPYKSFTNEFGTVGVHYTDNHILRNINTTSLYCGKNVKYRFGEYEELSKYDCFFQPISLMLSIKGKTYHTTFNIYNCRKRKNITTEYVITPLRIDDCNIVASYPGCNIPFELNLRKPGKTAPFFFLYKTDYFMDAKLSYPQKRHLKILYGAFEAFIFAVLQRIKIMFN